MRGMLMICGGLADAKIAEIFEADAAERADKEAKAAQAASALPFYSEKLQCQVGCITTSLLNVLDLFKAAFDLVVSHGQSCRPAVPWELVMIGFPMHLGGN